jgi:hypothetical protein
MATADPQPIIFHRGLVTCPRCRMHAFPKRMGSISRADDETKVCPGCGDDEAMINAAGRPAQPPEAWPVRWLPYSIELAYNVQQHMIGLATSSADAEA